MSGSARVTSERTYKDAASTVILRVIPKENQLLTWNQWEDTLYAMGRWYGRWEVVELEFSIYDDGDGSEDSLGSGYINHL